MDAVTRTLTCLTAAFLLLSGLSAPFVVRPRSLGAHRVAVVLPTNTWQAYNFEDKDSWYADPSVHTVDLSRPFVGGGVPPHYTGYDRRFIRWLDINEHPTDFLTDD